MALATIDCGTTNSRVYIVDHHGEVRGQAARKVGVKDTAATGSRETLQKGLREAFFAALQQAGLETGEVEFIISSGMITSEIGLQELPHIWAPAGMDDLAGHITRVDGGETFPEGLPVYFVRGVKNRYSPEKAGLTDAHYLDFMRGEETQVAGILDSRSVPLPVTVTVLSSHMKCIPVTAEGKIAGSLTTISGQVYEAILKETFLGKSVRSGEGEIESDYFDRSIIDYAWEVTREAGFLRAMLLPRFQDTLLQTEWYERKLFVEAVMAAEDAKALSQFSLMGFPEDSSFLLVGGERRCRIYEHLLKEKLGIGGEVRMLTSADEIASLSIKGALFLARKAGLME